MYPLPQRARYADRTFQSVQKNLANTVPKDVSLGDSFLGCRYDPFSKQPMRTSIPDGRGKHIIVRDYKTVYDLTVPGTEVLEARISPTYPYAVRFSPYRAPTATVNGLPIGTSATMPPAFSTTVGIPVSTAMSSSFNSLGLTTADSINISSARIVTVGYRLYYSGSAAAATGLVTVDDMAATVTARDARCIGYTQYSYSPGGTVADIVVPANVAPQIILDAVRFGTNYSTTEQVVLRPENGLNGVLKMTKLASDHEFVPWYDSGTAVLSNIDTGNSLGTIYAHSDTLTSPGARHGVFFWDDAFQEANIRISPGGSGSVAFRLEVAVCLEMEVALTSSLIDLARPSPLFDGRILDADMKLNSAVVAAPLTMPPLDMSALQSSMASMSIRRQRVRRAKLQVNTTAPKSGKAARRRRARRRRAQRAKANNAPGPCKSRITIS